MGRKQKVHDASPKSPTLKQADGVAVDTARSSVPAPGEGKFSTGLLAVA